jgi:hypothetical protein
MYRAQGDSRFASVGEVEYSEGEKADLFAGTAIRAYRLPEPLGQLEQ